MWGLGVVNVYHYGLSLQVVIYGDDLFMCMDHEYILRCMVMILVRIMVLFSVSSVWFRSQGVRVRIRLWG